MYPLGLSAVDHGAYLEALESSHELRTRIVLLDEDERPLAAFDDVLEGAVTFDDDLVPDRQLRATVLDTEGRFLAESPDDGALEARRFVRAEYGIKVAGSWVDVPVFTGPIIRVGRVGAEVALEAVGKEALLVAPYLTWTSQTYGRHTKVVDAIRRIAREQGERRFRLPSLAERIPKHVSIPAFVEPWSRIRKLASRLNRVPYYDGAGYLSLRRRVRTKPVYVFGPEVVLGVPEYAWDFSELRNAAVVKGPDPDGPQRPVVVRETLPPAHPLSPGKMARNGVPRRAFEVVELDKRRRTALRREALSLLETYPVAVGFDSLPVPHVELGDVCRLVWEGEGLEVDVKFPLRHATIPLSVGETMTVGYLRRRPTKVRRHGRGGGQ